MLLVDSLYINVGGGKVLLDYLVKEIEARQIDVFYLFDLRCKNDFKQVPSDRKVYLKASFFNRYKFYKRNKENFSKILCFGNIPPPCKINSSIVYTYFHNVLIFNKRNEYSIGLKLKVYLRNKLFKLLKKFSNLWIVQSSLVKDKLVSYLNISADDCLVYPFFDLSEKSITAQKKANTYLYVSSGASHKNLNRLLDAWLLVYQKGYIPELHLTIPQYEIELINKVNVLVDKGVKVVNHGFIDKTKLSILYAESEYLIFPSLFESFGLPLLEAVTAGCKVIASDLDYTHNVIKPSLVFNPMNIDSIADAIIFSLKNELMPSETKVKNEIDQILKILS
jgi:glycosyltransferase involved in cell wall biosynthesis